MDLPRSHYWFLSWYQWRQEVRIGKRFLKNQTQDPLQYNGTSWFPMSSSGPVSKSRVAGNHKLEVDFWNQAILQGQNIPLLSISSINCLPCLLIAGREMMASHALLRSMSNRHLLDMWGINSKKTTSAESPSMFDVKSLPGWGKVGNVSKNYTSIDPR